MATNYYVNNARADDTGAGTSWATAKKTISAALALITNANGDYKINIAPGVYTGASNKSLTPPYKGVVNLPNIIRGDYDESVTDGSSATHGLGNGPIILHAEATGGQFIADNDYDYWEIIGLICISSGIAGPAFSASTPGQAINYFRVTDCIFYVELGCVTSSGACATYDFAPPDTDGVILFNRCVFFSGNPMSWKCYSSSEYTNWPIQFKECQFLDTRNDGISIVSPKGSSATSYTSAQLIDCTLFCQGNYIAWGSSATYNKVKWTRCLAHAGYGPGGCTNSYSDTNYVWPSALTNWTAITSYPFLPIIKLLNNLSDIGTKLSGASVTAPVSTTDIFLNSRPNTGSNNRAPGCQEPTTDYYPSLPMLGPNAPSGTPDYPDVGNVTEDDTVNGIQGTYHEPTVAEVQDGVMFGASSALGGTYAGASGGRPEIRGGNL